MTKWMGLGCKDPIPSPPRGGPHVPRVALPVRKRNCWLRVSKAANKARRTNTGNKTIAHSWGWLGGRSGTSGNHPKKASKNACKTEWKREGESEGVQKRKKQIILSQFKTRALCSLRLGFSVLCGTQAGKPPLRTKTTTHHNYGDTHTHPHNKGHRP